MLLAAGPAPGVVPDPGLAGGSGILLDAMSTVDVVGTELNHVGMLPCLEPGAGACTKNTTG